MQFNCNEQLKSFEIIKKINLLKRLTLYTLKHEVKYMCPFLLKYIFFRILFLFRFNQENKILEFYIYFILNKSNKINYANKIVCSTNCFIVFEINLLKFAIFKKMLFLIRKFIIIRISRKETISGFLFFYGRK